MRAHLLLVFSLLLLVPIASCSQSGKETEDRLLKSIEEQYAAWAKPDIKSLSATYNMKMKVPGQGSMAMAAKIIMEYGGRVYMEMDMNAGGQQQHIRIGFDGESGWMEVPGQGIVDAPPEAFDQYSNLLQQADPTRMYSLFTPELIRDVYHYEGETNEFGFPAYKLRVDFTAELLRTFGGAQMPSELPDSVFKNAEFYIYLDQKTLYYRVMDVRMETQGQRMHMHMKADNWDESDQGLPIPRNFSMKMYTEDNEAPLMQMDMTDMKVNPVIDESIFTKPE